MSGATNWWQATYGKLVQYLGGPIVERDDHRCTGRSSDMPLKLARFCYPDWTGIGSDDQRGWKGYVWLDSPGGLIVRPAFSEGKPYVVAGRVRSRFEKPETRDRIYTQAHYLATGAENVAASLPRLNLPAHLVAKPGTAVAPLPDKQILPTEDWELGEGWLASIRPMLEPILTGSSVAIVDVELAEESFYRRAMICLACLPTAVRWRISFGWGMRHVNSEAVVLGHGMSAQGGVQYANGQWQGTDRLPPMQVKRANHYLDWLHKYAGEVKTISELLERIDEGIPMLKAWDAMQSVIRAESDIPALSDWRTAINELHVHLAEEDVVTSVEKWLKQNSSEGTPSLQPKPRYNSKRILSFCGEAWSGHGQARHRSTEVVLPILAGWEDEWRSLAAEKPDSRLAGLAMLLGYVNAEPGPVRRALKMNIPSGMYDRIFPVLQKALRAATEKQDLNNWGRVAVKCLGDGLGADEVSPFAEYLKKHPEIDRDLFWTAWRSRNSESEAERTFGVPRKHAALQALAAIERGSSPDGAAFLAVKSYVPLRSATGDGFDKHVRESVLDLANRALNQSLFAESLLLLQWLGAGAQSPEAYLKNASPDEFANQIAGKLETYEFDPLLFTIVVSHWDVVSEVAKQAVQSNVARLLGDSWVRILLGDEVVRRGKSCQLPPQLLDKVYLTALECNSDVLRRALDASLDNLEPAAHQLLIGGLRLKASEWAGRDEPTRPVPPEFRWLCDLVSRRCFNNFNGLPELNLQQARTVYAMTTEPIPRGLPNHVKNLGQLRTLLASRSLTTPHCSPYCMFEALSEVVGQKDPSETHFLCTGLTSLKAEFKAPWRLLFPYDGVKSYEQIEEDILSGVEPKVMVRMLLAGWPAPKSLATKNAPRIEVDTLYALNLPPEYVGHLVSIGEKCGASGIGEAALHYVIKFTGDLDRETLIDELIVGQRSQGLWSRLWPRRKSKRKRSTALGPQYDLAKRAWMLWNKKAEVRRNVTLEIDKLWPALRASPTAFSRAEVVPSPHPQTEIVPPPIPGARRAL